MPLPLPQETLVRKHSLNLKFNDQLEAMRISHQAKLDRLRAPGGDYERYVENLFHGQDAVRWELHEQNPDWVVAEIEEEFLSQFAYYTWEELTLQEIVDIISIEQTARGRGEVDRTPIGTTYYVDGDAGNNSYTGTEITGVIDSVDSTTIFRDSTLTGLDDYINGSFFYNVTTGHKTTIADFASTNEICTLTDADASMASTDTYYILHAWLDADQFTENARSAGDVGIFRRETTVSNGTDLLFTSDGTKVAPITIEADYANKWRDDVDLQPTATATLAFGNKAVLFSADITSVIATGDCIYAASDAAKSFAYKVALAQASDSGTDDGADSNKLIDTGKFTNTVIGTQVVNTTDAITGYVSELVSANEVEVTNDGRPSGKGGTIVVFDNGDTFTVANQAVLFLPYKGDQAGSGKTMTNMQGGWIWGTAAGDFQWNFDGDNNWKVGGGKILGTDSNGNVEIDGCLAHEFFDMDFEGNGALDYGIRNTDDAGVLIIHKCHFFNHLHNMFATLGAGSFVAIITDSLLDGNSVASSNGIKTSIWDFIEASDTEFRNHGLADISAGNQRGGEQIKLRNCLLTTTTEILVSASSSGFGVAGSEDHNGSLGVNGFYSSAWSISNTAVIYESDTGTVRSGGGARSIKVTPSTNLGTAWKFSRALIGEWKVFVDTSSQTYTVYFAADDETDWDANPTAAQIYLELETWEGADFNHRKITLSTGTLDFQTDTDFDQTLTVTAAPGQAGQGYLRAYCAFTKESGNSNIFRCDSRIGIA